MLTLTNRDRIPLSLAIWLATDDYDKSNNPDSISVTTILKPLRMVVLARQNRTNLKQGDISQLIPSRMGTAIHDSIEKAWKNPDIGDIFEILGYNKNIVSKIVINPTQPLTSDQIPIYIEQRTQKQCGKFTVTGKFDFVPEGTLEDFKSTSVFSWTADDKDKDYILQGSLYRWLNPQIITEDYMNIRFIFTDWSNAAARRDKTYPQSRLMTKTLKLMSIPETEVYVNTKLKKIESLETVSQLDLPMCTKEELWQKPDVWKYYKNPEKLDRSTKNYNNEMEAYNHYTKDGSIGIIKYIPGEVVRCRYCDVSNICTQAKMFIDNGLLAL